MAPSTLSPDDHLYQFGPFVADPVMGVLRRDGSQVDLPSRSFAVLMLLVEQRGAIVTKETIFERVWPGAFVAENNLARHISNLRKALHETPNEPHYILTIQGTGYRFVAAVRELTRGEHDAISDLGETSFATPLRPATSSRRLASMPVLIASVAGIIALLAVAWLVRRDGVPVAGNHSDLGLRRLTFHGGLESEPTWAADGKAIAYSSDRTGNFDVWIQPAQGGDATRLTTSEAHDWQPSWSADGSVIAFRSERDGGGLYAVAAGGGVEQRLTTFGYRPRWSPHGNSLLFYGSSDTRKPTLFLLDRDDGQVRGILAEFLLGFESVTAAAWHPDGRRVSIYGTRREDGLGFWTVPLDGNSPPIRSQFAAGVSAEIQRTDLAFSDFAWSPTADAIYLEGRSGEAVNVWLVRMEPQTLEWRLGPERVTVGAGLDTNIAISADGHSVAFTTRTDRTQVRAFPFDPSEGKLLGDGKVVSLAGADAVSPDLSAGDQLVYRVSRGARQELWSRSLSGGNDKLLFAGTEEILDPVWSADGSHLVFERREGQFPGNKSQRQRELEGQMMVIQADGSKGRPVTASAPGSRAVRPTDWSTDASSILAACRDRTTGAVSICDVPVGSGPDSAAAVRIVASDPKHNLWQARYSPNRRWIGFNATSRSDAAISTIGVTSAKGGAWVSITDGLHWDDKPRWAPDGRTIYFVSNRSGFLNVWGRRFDQDRGVALGQPFRVTGFEKASQRVSDIISTLSLAIDPKTLILPVTESTGSIWVLERTRP